MADRSSIEWTDATWNIVTGCSRVSRGCQNCYAERLAATRLKHHPSRAGLADRHGWTGKVRFNESWLTQPMRWQDPRRIFVAAHGDLFHGNVPSEWIDAVFAVMHEAPRHTYQLLTKRPGRARDYFAAGRWSDPMTGKLPSYIHLGVSVEDQPTADERIPILLDIPAAVRWISAEPLLGQIEIDEYLWAGAGRPRLDWVVAGGESGPGARPLDPSWPRTLRNQCICARVPFFFKQWGGISSKAGGCELDGRQWRQMPGELG